MHCNLYKHITTLIWTLVLLGGSAFGQDPNVRKEIIDGQTYLIREVSKDSLDLLLSTADTFDMSPFMHYLDQITVVANIRDSKSLQEQSISFSALDSAQLTTKELTSTKDISGNSPNFFISDMGSSVNSAIFVRGFGSLTEDPVVGMNVDNVPVLSKSAFNADLFDLERIEVLRGPQGTATGRNSLMGVMNIYTLSPLKHTGTHLNVDYSTANTINVKASTYHKPSDKNFGVSAAVNFKHTNGFFTNEETGKKCDFHNGISARLRTIGKPREKFTIDNVVAGGYISEGAYPYAFMGHDNKTLPIQFDADSKYKRGNFSDGLVIQYTYDKFIFSSITGYQFMTDEINYDADYSAQSLITRKDEVTEHAVSHEFAFRSTTRPGRRYNWKAGIWAFFKYNKSDMPITYHTDGLDKIFCQNVETTLRQTYPFSSLQIEEDDLTVSNNFEMPTFGLAGYHQSEIKIGKRWEITAGFRLDFEQSSLDYLTLNDLYYTIAPILTNEQEINTYFYGTKKENDFKVMPKLSVQYRLGEYSQLYAYAAGGRKTGGYNLGLFSDLIQNQIANQILTDANLADNEKSATDLTDLIHYDAERTWNFEFGGHLLTPKKYITFDFALFYIIGRNQQIHTFPTKQNTSNLIVNADQSRSFGAELSTTYQHTNPETNNEFRFTGTYGYTNAQFTDFEWNGKDYKGKCVPYSPSNTLSLDFSYTFAFDGVNRLTFGAGLKGCGKIYWDLENSYSEPYYMLINANATYQHKGLNLKLWAQNLADKEFRTYSFSNLDKQYCKKGAPRQVGFSIGYNFK